VDPEAPAAEGITVVVMAYDEAASLEAVVRDIVAALERTDRAFEILVVDDGSTDGTGPVADRLAATIDGVRVVHHPANRGLGGVYRTGFGNARRELVTFFPADGQFPAEIVERFAPLMDGRDMVLGYLPGGRRSIVGGLLSWGERMVYRMLFGPLPRFQGILMFRRTLLDGIELRSEGRGWAVVMELIVRVVRGGGRVRSEPTPIRPRTSGRSKVQNARTVWSNLRQSIDLWRILRAGRSRTWPALAALALGAALATGLVTRHAVAAADEVIYVVGARNLVERGTLDTNFYLPQSLFVQGYPHRDVHMPGYLFALAPFVAVLGPGPLGPAALNVLLLVALVVLVHSVARELLGDTRLAAAAAALAAVLPPFPGYLYVAFPELLLPVLLLAGVRLALFPPRPATAALSGALFGLGPLFRENLLFSLPIFAALLPLRLFAAAFLPAAGVVAAVVYAAFGSGRAQLPNAVYPGILFESLRSSDPVARFAEALWANLSRNLRLAAEARPAENPEDAVLLFLVVLGGVALAGAVRLRGRSRRAGFACVVSFALVVAALFTAYALRATGRPWAGVRQLMAWEPLLLVYASAAVAGSRRRVTAASTAVAAVVFVAVSGWHVRFVNRDWKGRDLEASERFIRHVAPWIDRARPRRIAVRSNDAFLYGLTRFPVEVIWPIRGFDELAALERVIGFDFLVVPRDEPMRAYLEGNARYRRVDPGGERARYHVWRRIDGSTAAGPWGRQAPGSSPALPVGRARSTGRDARRGLKARPAPARSPQSARTSRP